MPFHAFKSNIFIYKHREYILFIFHFLTLAKALIFGVSLTVVIENNFVRIHRSEVYIVEGQSCVTEDKDHTLYA